MNLPFALSLFLVDGTAEGLKVIEKTNWNGSGFACPKKVLFEKHYHRDEFKKPGVYLLIGENENNLLNKRLYIGESDSVMPRLEDHYRKKEWWIEVIVFTSNDQTVNKELLSSTLKLNCFKWPPKQGVIKSKTVIHQRCPCFPNVKRLSAKDF